MLPAKSVQLAERHRFTGTFVFGQQLTIQIARLAVAELLHFSLCQNRRIANQIVIERERLPTAGGRSSNLRQLFVDDTQRVLNFLLYVRYWNVNVVKDCPGPALPIGWHHHVAAALVVGDIAHVWM